MNFRKVYTVCFSVAVFFGLNSASAEPLVYFYRTLKFGDRGQDVLLLQQILNEDTATQVARTGPGSPGNETFVFGPATKAAVTAFQEKYRSEILFPVGLRRGTGVVGQSTRKKLGQIPRTEAVSELSSRVTPASSKSSAPAQVKRVQTALPPPAPTVLSVYPNRVRRGDSVTVTGTNFAPTGNSIELMDGPVDKRFDNLSSSDGKTIAFVFDPPEIKTMSEAEIRALPAKTVAKIEKPIKAAGKTLSDALSPYQNIHSESELRTSLKKNGHSFDEIYNFYFVMVENPAGKDISKQALLHGLRSLPIPGLAVTTSGRALSSLGAYVEKFLATLFSTAYAQGGQYGGGFNTGIIMDCTCGDGYLTYMNDINGGGTGLYWFSWGFQADAGAGYISPNWLGGYQTDSATCSIYAGEDCVDIDANEPEKPWGTNLF